MECLFIFIKHHFRLLWNLIEWGNSFMFRLIYKNKMEQILGDVFKESPLSSFSYRRLKFSDIEPLQKMIEVQDPADLEYFHPHDFDIDFFKL